MRAGRGTRRLRFAVRCCHFTGDPFRRRRRVPSVATSATPSSSWPTAASSIAGPAADVAAAAVPWNAGHAVRRRADQRRLHRRARPLSATAGDRRRRQAAARMADRRTRFRRKRASATSSTRARSPPAISTRTCATASRRPPCSVPCTPRRSTRCSMKRTARDADDRRQGADGPQCARRSARHGERGYDESKALIERWHRSRPAGLRRSRRGSPRRRRQRSSKRLRRCGAKRPVRTCNRTSRKTCAEVEWIASLYPDARALSRRLRALRPARPTCGVRAWHSPRRKRLPVPARIADRARALSDVEQLPRQRAVLAASRARAAPPGARGTRRRTSAAERASRCCARCRRRARLRTSAAIRCRHRAHGGSPRAVRRRRSTWASGSAAIEPGRDADLVVIDLALDAAHRLPHALCRRHRRGARRAAGARRRSRDSRDVCRGPARMGPRRRRMISQVRQTSLPL